MSMKSLVAVLGVLYIGLAACESGGASPPRPADDAGSGGDCVSGATRCDGDDVQTCTAEHDWALVQSCTTACEDGACLAPVCAVGQRRCSEDGEIEQCDRHGLAWEFRQVCTTACEDGECIDQICSPFSRRCSGLQVEACSADGTAWAAEGPPCAVACSGNVCVTNASCSENTTRCNSMVVERCDAGAWTFVELCDSACIDGDCVACTPKETRCGGDSVQTCDSDGVSWSTAPAPCANGCSDGACTTCRAGDRECSGDIVEVCSPDGSGYLDIGACATSCEGGECTDPVCVPLRGRCSGPNVEVCNSNGTAFTAVETCTEACADGVCTTLEDPGDVCVPGVRRCSDTDIQACNTAGTGWFYEQSCVVECSTGACASGPACVPFGVHVGLGTIRPDGKSSTLVATATINDRAGTPVPDGTIVVVETTAGTLLATDADTSTTATEVLTFRGRTDAVLRAPSSAGEATVTFRVRGASSCAGSATVRFSNAGGTPMSVGIDFTSASVRAVGSANTTFWDTSLGRVTAGPSTYGLGQDGDLVVGGDAGPFSLTSSVRPGRTYPDAPNFLVGAIGTDYVIVDRTTNALSPGDEVLLINLQGGHVGAWELLTVARTDALRVYFAVSIVNGNGNANGYGSGGTNTNIAGERIMLQRVPRYRTVSVGGTLTAAAWNGLYGGVLFFKASETISVTGAIDMTGRGYRGATSNNYQGESHPGSTTSNGTGAYGGGGGGGYDPFSFNQNADTCYHWTSNYSGNCTGSWFSGGGGGYDGGGVQSTRYNHFYDVYFYGYGGNSYGGVSGSPSPAVLHLGSGGGAGYQTVCTRPSGAACAAGDSPLPVRTNVLGGNGGGLIVLYAPTIAVGGQIVANGTAVTSGGFAGTSGSGGTIYIAGNTVNLGSSQVTAKGESSAGSGGGDGRIRVDVNAANLLGSSNPTFTRFDSPAATANTIRLQTMPVNDEEVPTGIGAATIVALEHYLPAASRLHYSMSNDNSHYSTDLAAGTLYSFAYSGGDLYLRVDWDAAGAAGLPSVSGITISYTAL